MIFFLKLAITFVLTYGIDFRIQRYMRNYRKLFFSMIALGLLLAIALWHWYRSFPHPRLIYIHQVPVVELYGNFRQMGAQYGTLLKKPLQDFYRQEKVRFPDISYDLQVANKVYNSYPMRYKVFLQQAAQHAGLTLNQIKIINAFEWLMFGVDMHHCSFLALWGPYRSGKEVALVRNYDFSQDVLAFRSKLAMVIFHPSDGVSTLMLTYLGTLNATTLYNQKGLFLALNAGPHAVGPTYFSSRIALPILLLESMLGASSMEQLQQQLASIKPQAPYIINIANKDTALSVEMAPEKQFQRQAMQRGALVATNHFIDPAWDAAMLRGSVGSMQRRVNILKQLQLRSRPLSDQLMQNMFSWDLNQGGAGYTNLKKEGLYTAFGVMLDYHKGQLALRIAPARNWLQFDLKKLMQSS